MLLQSFHLAAKNLHMLLIPPGHFKQTGVSVAVCQPNRDTGEPGHLQAGHRLPHQGGRSTRDQVTVPRDKNALRQPSLQRSPSQTTYLYMAIAQRQVSKRGVELCQRRCRSSPGSLKCVRVRSVKVKHLGETSLFLVLVFCTLYHP